MEYTLAQFSINQNELERLAQMFEYAKPIEILNQALLSIPKLTFACSFGAEDMVILDMLMKINKDAHVFYLDTDLLFQETYKLVDIAKEKYGIPNLLRVRADLTLEEQTKQYGEALWARDPDLCCSIRKVRPLKRTLAAFEGWVTGIRRDQAPTRKNAQVFEQDSKFGLIKINPLVMWSSDEVWEYIRKYNVPYNSLHDKGYPSIGCHPCTKPILPGQDPRSGRWAGTDKTECGLHQA